MCHFARVDPGYSTQGALQDALEHIVRILSLLLGGQKMSDPGSPREGVEGAERGWGDAAQLARTRSLVQVKPNIMWLHQSFEEIVTLFLCLMQADQGLQLPPDQGAGVQGWKGQGPG